MDGKPTLAEAEESAAAAAKAAAEGETPEGEPAEDKPPRAPRSKKFNPDKPHGVVHGSSKAAYFQNGKYFNGQGKQVSGM